MKIGELVGIISRNPAKVAQFSPGLAQYGHKTKWVPPDDEIVEIEDRDPREVLPGKMRSYVKMLARYLNFLAEIGEAPTVLAVADLLGLNMPDGPGRLGDANRILKKAHGNDPIGEAASHFGGMMKQRPIDGYLWNAFVPTARVAPVDRRGNVDQNRGKCLWDNPIYFGYSVQLLNILADAEMLRLLIDEGVIPPEAFSSKSINGVRNEQLVTATQKMPGRNVSIRVRYAGFDHEIDRHTNNMVVEQALGIATPAMSNVTPGLIGQMDQVIRGFSSR